MTIKEVQLPLDNLRKKLREELKDTEATPSTTQGGDLDFRYLEGVKDGLRLAIFFLSKEEQRLSKVV